MRDPERYERCLQEKLTYECEKDRHSSECKNSLEKIKFPDPYEWCKRETMGEFYDKHPVLLVLSLPFLIIIAPIVYLIGGD